MELTIRRKYLIAGGTVVALAAGGVGVASAVGDADQPATGPQAESAKAAALKLVPGGTVKSVERDSEKGSTWDVEVRKPDGSTVDVRLGADYQKVSVGGDSETE
jgi:hypothetical protein